MNSIFKSISYHFHPNNDVPDMEFNYSLLANHLSMEIYKQYYHVKTESGFTMQKCIQPGVDNPGTPSKFTVGVVAGDEESYETFKDLFDPIIEELHDGYGPSDVHHTDLDASKLTGELIIDIPYLPACLLSSFLTTALIQRHLKIRPLILWSNNGRCGTAKAIPPYTRTHTRTDAASSFTV